MMRTQISLEDDDRRILDEAAARTGRSISALIRDAVQQVYGTQRSEEADLAAMDVAFGAWKRRRVSGADWVEGVRSGRRLASGE
jgi:hypothetical protein